ncbi:MAG: tRNA (5-methylaminomethyl-2-thiouridine)(34)-methyltransferase MnmD [Bacteroidales bacterium]
MNQHYHSTFGAIQESETVYIDNGLRQIFKSSYTRDMEEKDCINILEVGFGTGLNALLTFNEATRQNRRVNYTAIEAFPLGENCWRTLNYPDLADSTEQTKIFTMLHLSGWNKIVEISNHFTLHKIHSTLERFVPEPPLFGLVYFDAFGPDVQPELWIEAIFQKISNNMIHGGTLVTYSVKGTVVRALQAAGFSVEKLPGPPGKRHILRAKKL